MNNETHVFKPDYVLPDQHMPEFMKLTYRLAAYYAKNGDASDPGTLMHQVKDQLIGLRKPVIKVDRRYDSADYILAKVEKACVCLKNAGLLRRDGKDYVLGRFGTFMEQNMNADVRYEFLDKVCGTWRRFETVYDPEVTEAILDRMGFALQDNVMQDTTHIAEPGDYLGDSPEIVTEEPEYRDGPEIISLEDVEADDLPDEVPDDVADHDAGTPEPDNRHLARFASNVSSALPWKLELVVGGIDNEERDSVSGNGYGAHEASFSTIDVVPEGFEAAVANFEASLSAVRDKWRYFLRVHVADLGIRRIFRRSSAEVAVSAPTYDSLQAEADTPEIITTETAEEANHMYNANPELRGPGSGDVIIERLLQGTSPETLINAGASEGTVGKHECMIRYIEDRGISSATTKDQLIAMFKSDPRKTSDDAEGYDKRVCHIRQVLKIMDMLGMTPAVPSAPSIAPIRFWNPAGDIVVRLHSGANIDDIVAAGAERATVESLARVVDWINKHGATAAMTDAELVGLLPDYPVDEPGGRKTRDKNVRIIRNALQAIADAEAQQDVGDHPAIVEDDLTDDLKDFTEQQETGLNPGAGLPENLDRDTVMEAMSRGESVVEIARKYGVTEDQVNNLIFDGIGA